jgi:DNA-binding protein H-NS
MDRCSLERRKPTKVAEVDAKSKRIVIGQIETLMEFWDISVEDLEESARDASTPAVDPHEAASAVVQFRHPVTQETWDGLGPQPAWLRRALLEEGYRVEELRTGH